MTLEAYTRFIESLLQGDLSKNPRYYLLLLKALSKQINMAPKGLKNLGWANGWSELPELVKEARAKGFKETSENIGNCNTKYICEEGGYYYMVDSSD